VSATCANTGISMACIDIEISPSPLDGQRDGLLRPYTVDLGARVPGLQAPRAAR
jgi:hypothetical protein